MQTDLETLRRFLNFPLTRTGEIFQLFSTLSGARIFGTERKRVLYCKGKRPIESGRCLLVAHADTVWDETWPDSGLRRDTSEDDFAYLVESGGVIRSGSKDRGIGADDRAGLAMLWLLKELGHSLLITDLEEHGRLGSVEFQSKSPKRLARINRDHAFAIQFDRGNARDFKCYDIGTDGFREYLRDTTGYIEPDRRSFTDICTLCAPHGNHRRMCGVNLSVGYYEEHSPDEYLVIREWLHTLELSRAWLSQQTLPTFRQEPKNLIRCWNSRR